MSVGIVILAHDFLYRTAQLAAALDREGCRVAIHLDARVAAPEVERFRRDLGAADVVFVERTLCEWGKFSLVEAGSRGAVALLDRYEDITHVCLISGACLPVRPVRDLQDMLAKNLDTDFVESIPADQNDWVKDGLSEERFTLFFPFSWRRQRWLFDAAVTLQRHLRVRRRLPQGIVPHIGSQWWCLSRATLRAIFADPELPRYDAFFSRTWIPDESYFQTLVRKHGRNVVSRSLTFARFDHQGKPFIFYDDHAGMLAGLDAYFARKMWHRSGALYDRFLAADRHDDAERTQELSDILARAVARRTKGRPGLTMQSRFTSRAFEKQFSSARSYVVLDGIAPLFGGFAAAICANAGVAAQALLFAADRVTFAGGAENGPGNLGGSLSIRDYDPVQFLTSLVWNDRDHMQCLLLDSGVAPELRVFVANDPNARLFVVEGGWLLQLCAIWRECPSALPELVRKGAADEALLNKALSAAKAQVKRWPLADVLANPQAVLAAVANELPGGEALTGAELQIPSDFAGFVSHLDSIGLVPEAAGNLSASMEEQFGIGTDRNG